MSKSNILILTILALALLVAGLDAVSRPRGVFNVDKLLAVGWAKVNGMVTCGDAATDTLLATGRLHVQGKTILGNAMADSIWVNGYTSFDSTATAKIFNTTGLTTLGDATSDSVIVSGKISIGGGGYISKIKAAGDSVVFYIGTDSFKFKRI